MSSTRNGHYGMRIYIFGTILLHEESKVCAFTLVRLSIEVKKN
jgi:hypothetical protein